jgi:endonuclease/exonuclease/phosphatase family metal-dependent hydrolase
MTRLVLALLFTALLMPACGGDDATETEAPPGPPEPFGVMTFNVLCSFCDSSFDPWDERLAYFDDIFARYDPDIIGLQELALSFEVEQVQELLPGYEALFYRAPESEFTYPDATIMFRSDRFELWGSGEYWLSPTPEVASSTGFSTGMQLPRLVQWAELRDRKSRRSLYFASTHVDNNAPSQEESAPLILERTAPWADRMATVVVGDFNSHLMHPAYALLTDGDGVSPPLANTFDLAESWSVEHNQATKPPYDLDARIDHMFVAPHDAAWQVASWAVDLHVYGALDRYPSDHFAMFARMTAPEL